MKNLKSIKPSGRSLRCLLLLTIIGLLSIASTRSFGQTWPACPPGCPTDAPPTTVAWTGSGSYTFTYSFDGIHICNVKVCWCSRVSSLGNNDYTVTAVMISPGGCAGSTSISDIINVVFKDMLDHDRMGFLCPPCPNTTNYWREVRGGCWQLTVDPITGIDVWTVCTTHKWCMTPFQICCDPITGAQHKLQGATVVVGTCDPDCQTVTCPGN